MQQSLTEASSYPEYRIRRGHRPVLMKRAQFLFVLALLALDVVATWMSFYAAHAILDNNPDVVIGPFLEFWPLPTVYTAVLVAVFFSQRMYQRRRPVSHLDEFFKIIVYNLFAMLITVAVLTLGLPDFVYHRPFILMGAAINIVVMTLLRALHAQIQWQAQARGVGDDRVLVVGTGEVGRMLMQKILQNRKLGYHVIGFIDSGKHVRRQSLMGMPVLGTLVDIPATIERFGIDEVVIGLPESSHQDLVGIISPVSARRWASASSPMFSRLWRARWASAISVGCRCSPCVMWRYKAGN
jgi:FlaA1/EpsC-like NDP-sugar epimerase